MGIDVIDKKNGEQLIEYKLPNFNENQFNIGNNPEDFEILQVLGHGSFSQVLKVKSKINYGIYALKKVDMAYIIQDQDLSQKYFENEVLFLKKLNHPNIIKCYNIFQVNQYLYFLMEFMNNGDLQSYNEGIISMKVKIPEAKLWEIFYKCLSGLDYIHKQGVVHRDIKLQNLFLDDNFNVKIGDFNISAVINENAALNFAENQQQAENLMNTNTTLGSGHYQAPEIGRRRYDQKVDIYSMGVSFYELCYGCSPKSKKKKDSDEGFYSNEIREFINAMINEDESKRPSCNEAMVYAKNFFIKLYVKNTCVESVFNCFSNYVNLINFFSHNEIVNYIFSSNKEISKSVFSTIQSINDEKQKGINLYELRKALENEGLDVKSDSQEIDPGNFLILLLSKLNSELNEITPSNKKISENEKIRRYKILSKQYCFSPGEEEKTFILILETYNLKILSIISRTFFSYIKTKRSCLNCGFNGCYFSKMYFIPINMNILQQKFGYNQNVHLKDAIDSLKTSMNINKGIKCKNCNQISQFKESKMFYHTAKNLIFIFDRGENSKNNYFLNFDDNLVLNRTDVERYNEVQYQLIGMIVKVNDEYISFTRKVINNNIWQSSKGETFNFIDAKKYGLVIALFYYSEADILSISCVKNVKKNQSQMQNPSNQMNNYNAMNQNQMSNFQNQQFNNNWNNNPNQFNGGQGNQMNQNNFNNLQNMNNNNNPQMNPQLNQQMLNNLFNNSPINPQVNPHVNPQFNFNEQNVNFGGNNQDTKNIMNNLFNGNMSNLNNNNNNYIQPFNPMNNNSLLNVKTINVLDKLNDYNKPMNNNNGMHNNNMMGINNNNFNGQNNRFGNGNNPMNNNMNLFNNMNFQ